MVGWPQAVPSKPIPIPHLDTLLPPLLILLSHFQDKNINRNIQNPKYRKPTSIPHPDAVPRVLLILLRKLSHF